MEGMERDGERLEGEGRKKIERKTEGEGMMEGEGRMEGVGKTGRNGGTATR